MTARRTNITGIERLSIGTTKNDRDYILCRYVVNLTKPIRNKSFYFGKNTTQMTAFLNAIRYMKDEKVFTGTMKEAKEIYKQYKHEQLIEV